MVAAAAAGEEGADGGDGASGRVEEDDVTAGTGTGAGGRGEDEGGWRDSEIAMASSTSSSSSSSSVVVVVVVVVGAVIGVVAAAGALGPVLLWSPPTRVPRPDCEPFPITTPKAAQAIRLRLDSMADAADQHVLSTADEQGSPAQARGEHVSLLRQLVQLQFTVLEALPVCSSPV